MNINLLRLSISVYLLLITETILCQNNSFNSSTDQILETLYSTSGDAILNSDIAVENYVEKLERKLDLNRVTREQLTELLILTPYQVKSILSYREKNGGFKSIYELQVIKGVDRKTLLKIIPYLTVDITPNKIHSSFKNKIIHDISLRYDQPLYKKKGELNQFLGPSFYSSFRYSCSIKDRIEFGLVGEKDSYEPLFGLKNKQGFDYYSYYILIKNIYKISKILVGKYRVNIGLGLTLGDNFITGKWNAFESFFKSKNEVKKHASVSEVNFLEGIALIYKNEKYKIIPFCSYKKRDGVIRADSIQSLLNTGFHRTNKEFKNKNTVSETLLGIRFNYDQKYFDVGINSIYYKFNFPLTQKRSKYEKYTIYGNHFYNLSLDYSVYLNAILFKGEIAKSKRGMAYLNKIYYAPNSEWNFLLLHRFYDVDYWSLFSNSFSSQTSIKNENGLYFAIQSSCFYPFKIQYFIDYVCYPWLKYRVSKPSKTLENGLLINYDLSIKHHLALKISNKFFERDRVNTKGKITDHLVRNKYKLTYDGFIFPHVNLKTIVDFIDQKGLDYQKGIAMTERLSLFFNTKNKEFKCDFQCSYFKVDSFDTRIYIYEKGVLYNSYIPAYYNRGYRMSLNLNYKPLRKCTLMFKCGLTDYLNKSKIGLGISEIDSHLKSDIQFMVRLKV